MNGFKWSIFLAMAILLILPSAYSLGVAPAKFNIDYVVGEIHNKNLLVVNTIEEEITVTISADDPYAIIDLLGVEEVVVGSFGQQTVPFVITIKDINVLETTEIPITLTETVSSGSQIGAQLSISTKVILNVIGEKIETEEDPLTSSNFEADESEENLEEEILIGESDDLLAELENQGEGPESSSESLVEDDLGKVQISSSGVGKVIIFSLAAILMALLGFGVYRLLHPKHDF